MSFETISIHTETINHTWGSNWVDGKQITMWAEWREEKDSIRRKREKADGGHGKSKVQSAVGAAERSR
jgi:hypothetical protein